MESRSRRNHRRRQARASNVRINPLVSVASLLVGVLGASFEHSLPLLTGLAWIVAGSMSMAAGEYVSVSSQADSEAADLAREGRELDEHPEHERRELAAIYIKRGLSKDLATQVADALSFHDRLKAHARDELALPGIRPRSRCKPRSPRPRVSLQAASPHCSRC